MKWKLIAVLTLVPFVTSSLFAEDAKKKQPPKRRPNSVFAPVTDDPNLPRVLLIGDSISIGYTLGVRDLLKGKANVHRPPTNCGPTTKGLAEIDKWLGDSKWDIIHFNWGLHDLKYLGSNGQNLADPNDPKSHQQVAIDQYEKNMRKLVARLRKTGAKLIWRATTPVPEGAKGRVPGDAAKYNKVAEAIMNENGIMVDDAYLATKPKLKEIQLPANVHFTKDGSKFLAKRVATILSDVIQTLSS